MEETDESEYPEVSSHTVSEDFTEEQLDQYYKAFMIFDRKGDKTMNVKDLGLALQTVGINLADADIEVLAEQLEGDSLDFSKFLEILTPIIKDMENEDYLRDAFRVFDKYGTGQIPMKELREILSTLGDKWTDKEINELIKAAEVDRKGNVDYNSLVNKLAKYVNK